METNGTVAKQLKEARQHRRLLEEQARISNLRAQNQDSARRAYVHSWASREQARLLESWSEWYGWRRFETDGAAPSPLYDRVRGRDEHDQPWVPPNVPSDRRHGEQWPIYRSETELAKLRQASRILCQDNGFARGLLFNRTNYIIGTGFKYKAVAKKDGMDTKPSIPGTQEPNEALQMEAVVQRWLDRWLTRHKWATREREAFGRTNEDFECFIRIIYEDEGKTKVRFVEPECVKNPPNMTYRDGWAFGIKHQMDPEDVETVEKYFVAYQDSTTEKELGVEFDEKEIVHIKSPGTHLNMARGKPVFYGDSMNAFHRASQLQRAISIGSVVRAATAEYWVYEFGTETQVGSVISGLRDHTKTDGVTGKTESFERKTPGTTRHLPEGIKPYWPPGVTGVVDHLQAVQGDARLGGVAFAAPEYMVSGDASNANLASTLVASAPVVRAAESEQKHYQEHFLEVIDRCMRHAIEGGKLPDNALDLVEIECEPPKVIHRDQMQQAHVDQIYVMMGAKSRQKVSMELGEDWDIVKKENAEWEDMYPAFKDTIPPYPKGGGAGQGQGGDMRAPPGMGDVTRSMMASRELHEGESYFATCDRDTQGHCQSGGGSESGESKSPAEHVAALWAAGPKSWDSLSVDDLSKYVHAATEPMSPKETAAFVQKVLDRPDKKFKNKADAVEFLRQSFASRKGAFVRVLASRELEECGGEGGKPGPCAQGGGDTKDSHADLHAKASDKAKGLIAKTADLPRNLVGKAVNAAKGLYAKMEAKVGPRWAKAIVATAIITAPTPVMTGSIVAMTGLAYAWTRLVSGGHVAMAKESEEPDEPELTDEQVQQMAQEFLDELEREMGNG